MKNFLYIFIFSLFTVLSVFPKGVLADDQNEEVPSLDIEQTEIEMEDIIDLVVNPTKEVPEYKLVPRPTPLPLEYQEKVNDARSWTTSEYNGIIEKVSKKYNIDPQVIYATIMTESEGNQYAFRYEPHIKDASLGVGQTLISTAKRLGFSGDPKELYNPEVSIDLIGKYHRNSIDTYGELSPVQLAIAYNAGSPYKWPVYGHIYRFNMWYYEDISS